MDFAPGTVVARLRLPIPVTNMMKMIDYIEYAYGPGCRAEQAGEWWEFKAPTEEQRTEAEVDARRRAAERDQDDDEDFD